MLVNLSQCFCTTIFFLISCTSVHAAIPRGSCPAQPDGYVHKRDDGNDNDYRLYKCDQNYVHINKNNEYDTGEFWLECESGNWNPYYQEQNQCKKKTDIKCSVDDSMKSIEPLTLDGAMQAFKCVNKNHETKVNGIISSSHQDIIELTCVVAEKRLTLKDINGNSIRSLECVPESIPCPGIPLRYKLVQPPVKAHIYYAYGCIQGYIHVKLNKDESTQLTSKLYDTGEFWLQSCAKDEELDPSILETDQCLEKASVTCPVDSSFESGKDLTLDGPPQTFQCRQSDGVKIGDKIFKEVQLKCVLEDNNLKVKNYDDNIVAPNMRCERITCKIPSEIERIIEGHAGDVMNLGESGKFKCIGQRYIADRMPGEELSARCDLRAGKAEFDKQNKMKCNDITYDFCASGSLPSDYIFNGGTPNYYRKDTETNGLFKCKSGFLRVGVTGTRTTYDDASFSGKCKDNAEWDNSVECTEKSKIECPEIKLYGQFKKQDKDQLKLDDSRTFECQNGYSLQDVGQRDYPSKIAIKCTLSNRSPQNMNGTTIFTEIRCNPPPTTTKIPSTTKRPTISTTTPTTSSAPSTVKPIAIPSITTPTMDASSTTDGTATSGLTTEKTTNDADEVATTHNSEDVIGMRWWLVYGYGSSVALMLFLAGLLVHIWWSDRKWAVRVRHMEERGLRLGREQLLNSAINLDHR